MVVSIIFFFINEFGVPKQVEILEYDAYVADNAGFNLDPDKIHFGSLIQGSKGSRDFSISNDFNYDIRVSFDLVSKDSLDNIYVVGESHVISRNNQADFALVFDTRDLNFGFYQGQVIVKYYRVFP